MDPRVPPAPYPFERTGAKFPPHEVGQQTSVVKQIVLAQVIRNYDIPSYYETSLWMSVPDARLLAALSIVFEPEQVADLGRMTGSTIHLVSTVDCGGDPAPAEDLLGTAAAPVELVQPGLRALTYSPTEEVEGLRADLYLVGPESLQANLGLGRWVAKARWQALRPMTHIEWSKAVAEMVLLPASASPRQLQPYSPG